MSEAASPWPTSASKQKSTTPAQNPLPPQATILMSPPQRFSVKSKPSVRTAKRADFKAVPNKHSARKKNNARTRARGFPDRRGFGHSGLGIVAKTEAHLYQKKIRLLISFQSGQRYNIYVWIELNYTLMPFLMCHSIFSVF